LWLKPDLPVGHVEEDINIAVHTTEEFLAWAHGENRHVSQTVNTLRFVGWQSAIDDEAIGGIGRVDEIVSGWVTTDIGCWQARP
jgi:hypothetical protein